MLDRVYIISTKYINEEMLKKTSLKHRDSRVMDVLSKKALLLAREIFSEEVSKKIKSERQGIVIASDTGPCTSLWEHTNILQTVGFKGINPSKFPNTMLSTVLSRVSTEFNLKGPSTAMYVNSNRSEALEYAVVQILMGRSDLMAVMFIGEGENGFGILIMSQKFLLETQAKVRFYINCSNQHVYIFEERKKIYETSINFA
ncbi:beta-ketoacyl-[acyl-carrier-protein] synthase family protein [Alkaliphilus peptidifermentans]|uniref:Beta-ketoacyl synthase, N-terminal domain n=1 Tax=Alkaliphilus peptidifermentans DSM 18978 TaxID=1120976 RepID=A0A1G5I3Y8_9FIRM|nr:beta-ketoacyl synthase N-terminal-like domain-containing protein [Alkaliphilus peptidifermentans]SCY70380.1 Beta-ketoacyl synthase, N-terminal domain [Alkaliphilus peptidifermentans DSM 18978]